MQLLFILIVTVSASVLFTWLLRFYAVHQSILDVPNLRSSHTQPTPRGGGIAIFLSFLLAMIMLVSNSSLAWSSAWVILGAGGGAALIGFFDDHRHISVRWRLLGHFLCAMWALFWSGGLPPLEVFGFVLDFGWSGHVLAVLYLVWILNLYNFMDGIDGIASVEAICSCLGACILYWGAGFDGLIVVPLVLVMAVAGFLYWNFPPARIFMGDGGSGFLGLTLGVISLQAAWVSPEFFWVWLILLGVFIVDATVTLLRRGFRGEKVYEAHRSHAYQFASRQYKRHLPVTLAVVAINLLWLLPVAACVVFWGLDGALGLVLAYVPLVIIAVKFHAGEPEPASVSSDNESGPL
ncbi:Fuc2NAc and GlcNAc transferase [Pseudomonas sp. NFACC09-4]|uniref:MraY family glycosyltransferase n=1 Tax=Pseudomonas TaxID=286 RepID=UPI0009084F94|nr:MULTISPECIES: glycosyltransferase family 4 protein [Pseudomonas]MDT8904346.1 glycosyltransferase family 4 protein [Pseudomonas prosekii]NHN69282.1 glycosyltransferase family 4 protein [Pseudomonas fluorescens]ROO33819.1 glycosyl transferase [Pseudomonas sp. AF76]SFW29366.1 Fuc2NAc and GlcNAc transferase [Pseudomonas sp. NFACC09-4]